MAIADWVPRLKAASDRSLLPRDGLIRESRTIGARTDATSLLTSQPGWIPYPSTMAKFPNRSKIKPGVATRAVFW